MKYCKINSYTRVLDDGKLNIEARKRLINEKSLCKSSDFINKEVSEKKTPNNYKKFCNKVFRNRDFISQKDFHNLIIQHFGSNCSWYRFRMIQLQIITEKNKLIKPNYD